MGGLVPGTDRREGDYHKVDAIPEAQRLVGVAHGCKGEGVAYGKNGQLCGVDDPLQLRALTDWVCDAAHCGLQMRQGEWASGGAAG